MLIFLSNRQYKHAYVIDEISFVTHSFVTTPTFSASNTDYKVSTTRMNDHYTLRLLTYTFLLVFLLNRWKVNGYAWSNWDFLSTTYLLAWHFDETKGCETIWRSNYTLVSFFFVLSILWPISVLITLSYLDKNRLYEN